MYTSVVKEIKAIQDYKNLSIFLDDDIKIARKFSPFSLAEVLIDSIRKSVQELSSINYSSCRNWFVTEYGVYKLAIEKNNYISNKFAKRVREIVHDIKEMNIEKEIEHQTIQMDALKFLQEKTRMMLSDVKSYNELKNIPTNDGIVKFVCEWSKNHPVKTREEDFWKKHPNAKVDCDFYTEFCCETLGYCKKCNHNYDASFCKSCWNEQV